MKRFEKIKNDATLEDMAEIIMILSVRIAKKLIRDEYGEELEVSNFQKSDIKEDLKIWLSRNYEEK